MAPFKLFRLNKEGSTSRSTSQENDHPDQPANLVITTTSLNKLTNVMTSSAHYLNIEESDQTSENSSLMSLNNDQRALLSTGSEQIGYSSPQLSDVPYSPPPSYESVMKENQLLALDKENNTIQTTIHTNLLVESFYTTSHGSNNNLLSAMNEFPLNNVPSLTSPARENLLIDENDECTEECNRSSCNCINNEGSGNINENCDGYDERCLENDMMERCSLDNANNAHENYNTCSDEFNNCSNDFNNFECQNQYQDNDYSNQYDGGGGQQINYSENKGPEILYKSSKELYKAVAKQCGLQCKMTDTCRCVECQSRYFDCEFDHNDNEKTDGGLGAGTPMFVNEVLHGTACTIL